MRRPFGGAWLPVMALLAAAWPWRALAMRNDALVLESERGVAWTAADRAAIAAALPALPAPPGPFTLVLRAGPTADRLPMPGPGEFDAPAGRYFVHEAPSSMARDRAGTLLVAALAHHLAHAWDAREGWSADVGWRSIAGWQRRASAPAGDLVAKDRGAWPNGRERARFSPGEDLATYAERFLLEAGVPDAPARCDHPTRYRLLAAKFAAHGHGPSLADATCPTFERWIRPDDVEALEMVLAAPSASRPASLWGHLLVTVRYHEDLPVAPGFVPYFHVGANAAEDGRDVRHAWRGVTGGLAARVYVTPAHVIRRRYLDADARGLRRFEMRLSTDGRRRVMERLWEARRNGTTWRYFFFTDNCAGLLVELLRPALVGEADPGRPRGIRFPSAMLDRLGETAALDREPLLAWAGEVPGAADRAADAGRLRERLLESFSEKPGRDAVLESVRARDPARRLAGYESMTRWPVEPELEPFLAASLELEHHLGWRGGRPRGPDAPVSRLAALYGAVLEERGGRASSLPAAASPAAIRSGAYVATVAAGVAVDRGEPASPRPRLELGAAVLEEAPGDARRHGLRGDVSMTCLAFRLGLTPSGPGTQRRDGRAGASAARIDRWDSTIVSFRTLRRDPAEVAPEPARSAGWGVDVGAQGNASLGGWLAAAHGGPEIAWFSAGGSGSHLRASVHAGAGAFAPAAAPGAVRPVALGEFELASRIATASDGLGHFGLVVRGTPRLDLLAFDPAATWEAEAYLAIAAGRRVRPWTLRPGLHAGGAAAGAPQAGMRLELSAPW